MLAFRNEILPRLLTLVRRLDCDPPLVLVVAAEANDAGNLRDNSGFLRTPRLEQLRHPRQTAGDVACLGTLSRDTGNDIARADPRSRIDRDDGGDGEHVTGIAAAAELEDIAVLVLDHQRRAQILLTAGRTRAPVDNHALGDARRLVESLGERLAFDHILVTHQTLDFSEDR